MLRDLYDVERLLELRQIEREDRMRRDRALREARRAPRPVAGLSLAALLLSLLRLT